MTREMVAGLPSAVPIGSLLPQVYRDHDPGLMQLCEALDEVIAPVWLALDCFSAYLDPLLAPSDFVEMLAGWVGLPLDRNWTDDQLRRLVASAVELYRWRGTRRGLRELVVAYTGVEPTIEDSGGTVWSAVPGAEPPGTDRPAVRVTVDLPPDARSDLPRLTRLIEASMPAHVTIAVEARRLSRKTPRPAPPEPSGTDEPEPPPDSGDAAP